MNAKINQVIVNSCGEICGLLGIRLKSWIRVVQHLLSYYQFN